MTILPGPPYVQERRVKVKSPGWHRLPSTAWFIADAVLTVGAATLLVIDDRQTFWALLVVGLIAFVAAVGTFVSAITEISRHRKPVASVINLILSLLINPYVVAGHLVSLRVLDFG